MNKILLCSLLLLFGCSSPQPASGEVRSWGALHSMFQEGLVDATVGLDELLPDPELWAVGALSELRGEVTILAGEAYLSYPSSSTTSRTNTASESSEQATLLVASRVSSWIALSLNEEVRLEDLGARLRDMANEAGLDDREPFPFRIEGEVRDLAWHVIDGTRVAQGGMDHGDHLQASVIHELPHGDVDLIGFHSIKHGGVFTHMGSDTHVHCFVPVESSAGHVDQVAILPGAMVFLPSN